MQDPIKYKKISFEEITQLYEACGANLSRQQELRTTINTGTLNNKLNTNCQSASTTHDKNHQRKWICR